MSSTSLLKERLTAFEHVCIVRDYVTIVRIAHQLNLNFNVDCMYWYNGVDQNTVRFRDKEMLAEFLLAAGPGEITEPPIWSLDFLGDSNLNSSKSQ